MTDFNFHPSKAKPTDSLQVRSQPQAQWHPMTVPLTVPHPPHPMSVMQRHLQPPSFRGISYEWMREREAERNGSSEPQASAHLQFPALATAASSLTIATTLVQKVPTAATLEGKAGTSTEGQSRPNNTGLPDRLKTGIERLSGMPMDDVRVHYNSPEPAQLQALAYTQGSEIHVGPGQRRHLPHEAWHVVQQKQGRVKPTLQAKGIPINDDWKLECEADIMGAKALQMRRSNGAATRSESDNHVDHYSEYSSLIVQRFPIVTNGSADLPNTADGWFQRFVQKGNKEPKILEVLQHLEETKQEFESEKDLVLITRMVADKVERTAYFTASSGDQVNGFYHETAQQNQATNLQSRDAEVSMLQKIEDWLMDEKAHVAVYESVDVFIRISKGPCNSCRNLIKLFRARHPGVRIVLEYQQDAPITKDIFGKESDQKALSYGYGDAKERKSPNHFLKLFPGQAVEQPARVKGYRANTLAVIYEGFLESKKEIDPYIDGLPVTILNKKEDKPLLKQWLRQKVLYEQSHHLSEYDMQELHLIEHPQPGRNVTANAKLVLQPSKLLKKGEDVKRKI